MCFIVERRIKLLEAERKIAQRQIKRLRKGYTGVVIYNIHSYFIKQHWECVNNYNEQFNFCVA